MTIQQQSNLIVYGDSIGILVTPHTIDGQPGVAYCDWGYTNKAEVAHRDLLQLSLSLRCEGQAA
jgi:hypothetical protein